MQQATQSVWPFTIKKRDFMSIDWNSLEMKLGQQTVHLLNVSNKSWASLKTSLMSWQGFWARKLSLEIIDNLHD